MNRRRSSDRILMQIIRGGMVLIDEHGEEAFARKRLYPGDIVSIEVRKPRDITQHRKIHMLGKLLTENRDEFAGLTAHAVVKRLQLEAGLACHEIAYQIPGYGMVTQRIPQSLAFENMDEGSFQEFYAGICQVVIDRYWPDFTPEQIEELSGLVGRAA